MSAADGARVAARGHWGSRLGFILASAGSAVGLGNIWRFPYLTGENGGGAFLLIYLALLFTVAISVLLAEFVVGRAARRNAVGAYRALGGRLWPVFGFLGIAAGFVILSFYSVIGGWTIAYLQQALVAGFLSSDPAAVGATFETRIGHPLTPLLYHGVFMALTIGIALGGVRGGIERWSRLLMPVLFGLVIVLAVRSLTLPGASAGIAFFLAPDFGEVTGATVLAAFSQALFSLSVGMGAMVTYGSYLSREVQLPGATAWVASLDALIACLAGLVILPAVFAFGFDPSSGPGLTYITLPAVFAEMPAGALFGALFFLLLLIAAVTSAVSLVEPFIAFVVEEVGLRRLTAGLAMGALVFALGIPSAWSFGLLADVTLAGRTFFGWMDFLTTKLALPLGALAITLLVGWIARGHALAEVTGDGAHRFPLARLWLWTCGLVAPLAIVWILLAGLGLLPGAG